MCVKCFVCMYVYVPHAWFLSESGVGTGVMDSCETTCGCWEPNQGLLQEQSVLFNTELTLQLPAFLILSAQNAKLAMKALA